MVSGTSKKWSKSGPVALLIITKMLQTIQENYGIILEKYYLCQYGTQKLKKLEKCMSYVPCFCFFCENEYSFVEMRIENDSFFITKQHTDMDMNFICIKKHEMEIWRFGSIKHIGFHGSFNKAHRVPRECQ